tara:strand:- start:239 stop:364 length:126 start_codon:yes stop_codon:yes gene_type:complete
LLIQNIAKKEIKGLDGLQVKVTFATAKILAKFLNIGEVAEW